MGSELPALDLGTDFEPVELTAGAYHTCALSRRGTVKCWGLDYLLGLGWSAAVYIGSSPNEMGDSLPTLDLGAVPAEQISAGWAHACAAARLHPRFLLARDPSSHSCNSVHVVSSESVRFWSMARPGAGARIISGSSGTGRQNQATVLERRELMPLN